MTSHPLETSWIQVGRCKLYHRTGTHPSSKKTIPIILVHGLAVSSRSMIPIAQCLAAHYPVYLPDLPGYGKSEKPEKALTIEDYADVLAEYVHAIGVSKAVFLGNSFGCQIIVELALRHPTCISQAILIGPTANPSTRSYVRGLFLLLLDLLLEPLSYYLIVIQDLWDIGLWRALRNAHYAIRDPIEKDFPHINIPTLVMRGKQDPLVSQQWAETVTRLLPQASLRVIPHTSHMVSYQAPEQVSEEVSQFLSSTGVLDFSASQTVPSLSPSSR